MRFSAAPSQARSCASVAVAASTSEAAPVALRGTVAQPVGHRAGGRGEPRRLRRAGRLRPDSSGRVASPSTRGRAPGRITGAYCDSADHGNAPQDGAGRRLCRRIGRDVMWSKSTQSCEPDY